MEGLKAKSLKGGGEEGKERKEKKRLRRDDRSPPTMLLVAGIVERRRLSTRKLSRYYEISGGKESIEEDELRSIEEWRRLKGRD